MVVRRPTGTVLLSIKTFYPAVPTASRRAASTGRADLDAVLRETLEETGSRST